MSDQPPAIAVLDSHAHVISADTTRYPAAPPGGALPPGALDDPISTERLVDLMDETGVARAILVQRGSVYGFDNRYVCDSARAHADRFRAVCAIDAEAADSADAVRRWAGEGAIGIRLMQLRRDGGMGWLDSPAALHAWEAAAELEVPVCAHLFPWNREAGLRSLAAITARLPQVRLVIDHLSNIDALAGPPDQGIDALLAPFAKQTNIWLKFTTIPLGAMYKAGTPAGPLLQRLKEAGFGPERMMWGSDIGQSPGTYGFQAQLGQDAVAPFTEAERALLLGDAAATAYRWA